MFSLFLTDSTNIQSSIEIGNSSLIMPNSSETKWFSNLYYAQEWQVSMNAYKINESGLLKNGSEAFGNYSAKAIFSSTVKYL